MNCRNCNEEARADRTCRVGSYRMMTKPPSDVVTGMPALSADADVACCSDLAKKLIPTRQTRSVVTQAKPITR